MFVIEVIQVGMSRYEHCRYAHKFRGSHTAEQVAKQATEEMLNACETDKQCIHVILHITM